ncbi:MAG: S26 family signal peptidase [Planctomycetota bacterium]
MVDVPSDVRDLHWGVHQRDGYEVNQGRRKVNSFSRRRFLSLASAAAALPIASCRRGSSTPERVRIHGPSMNPTLWGDHRIIECPHCKIATRVDEVFVDRCLASPGDDRVICWHCGGHWGSEPIRMSQRGTPHVVSVRPDSPRMLSVGDLILIRRQDQLEVKRLMGRPGQTLLRLSDGRLSNADEPWPMNGTIMVDSDANRDRSRWTSDVPNGWNRDQRRHWNACAKSTDSIVQMTYQHRSVDPGNRSSMITDSIPGNLGLSRRLSSVDDLRILLTIATHTRPTQTMDRVLEVDHRHLNSPCEGALGMTIDPSIVSSISNIRIVRPIHYVGARSGSNVKFPLRLREDQWFVMGDNPPVSIDSRHWGPISTNQVVGRVIPM